ncbi:MAG: signal recognition particle protein [Clostridiales bacterium]|jgi:signal recognition particle subunit SRP54|nr:signal recognition particle protein [Clostridiales bacterium]
MAFESLSQKLQNALKSLRGKGKLNENDIENAMREVKLVLLEADVNFKVVKDFIARVSQEAKGAKVMESLSPAQMVIKIVSDEMARLMGAEEANIKSLPLDGSQPQAVNIKNINFAQNKPTVIMVVGLQGAGKTTTAAKLASLFRKHGKNPLLVACDVYRPAAIKQLKTLGKQLTIPVFSVEDNQNAPEIAKQSLEEARKHANDVIILDTAGRLDIDEELMDELVDIRRIVEASEVLLVTDSMMGQEAVSIAKNFDERLNIDGIILTKLDGDARGGAALSLKSVVGKPIKFIGIGEKLNDLEIFYPERMAKRILGMGDVLTLIDKAQEVFDEKQSLEMQSKMAQQRFDLDDFLVQLEQLQKMGPINQLVDMLPATFNKKQLAVTDVNDQKFVKIKAIIQSMTPKERQDPSIINGSRRTRIANGSATKVQDINALLTQFEQVKKMVKQMNNQNKWRKAKW